MFDNANINLLRKNSLLLLVLIALVYAGSLGGTFHFDDGHSIQNNIALHSLSNLVSLWTDPRTSSFIPENRVYRPLIQTSYAFCWWIGHGQTWPFHVFKLFLHWGFTVALFLIWRRLWAEPGWLPLRDLSLRLPLLGRRFVINPTSAAMLLAMVFAIHPAGSECVDYISATSSLQCAVFYVWAYYFYLCFRDSSGRKWLTLSILFYFLSVASKEEGITLPAMVFLTELFLISSSNSSTSLSPIWTRVRLAIRRALPYAVMGCVLGGWIWALHPESGNISRGQQTSWQYFITQWRAYLFYMRIWFWPWDLNADNVSVEFSRSIMDPLVLQSLIANLLMIGVCWTHRKRLPALWFGMLWFYVTITPASSVVVLAEAVNEHRMYLSYAGFVGGTFTLLLIALQHLQTSEDRETRLGWAYLLIMLGLMIGTQERNRVWANDENLWQDTVEKNPSSGRALNNLALVYMARGEFERANAYFERCEKVWPQYSYCPLNRGISTQAWAENIERTDQKEGAQIKLRDAEVAFNRAYALNPRDVYANFYLARLLERQGNYEKAALHYQSAITVTGGRHATAEVRLANCLLHLGRRTEALTAFDRARQLEPANGELHSEIRKIAAENGL